MLKSTRGDYRDGMPAYGHKDNREVRGYAPSPLF